MISSICKNKIVNKLKKPFIFMLIILFILYYIQYLTKYLSIFKKNIIEGNANIVQNECNINSSDSPEEVLKKFNAFKNSIDQKVNKLTDIANSVQATMESHSKQ